MRSFPLLTINHEASGAIEPYRCTKTSAEGEVAQAAAGTDLVTGISSNLGAATGERIDIEHAGVVPVQYGGTVAAGDYLASDADGKAVVAAGAAKAFGIAMEDGTADEIGAVLMFAKGDPLVQSGTWVPTIAEVANTESQSVADAMYIRVGNIVHFACTVTADPTADATLTEISLTPPIASDFAAVTDASGVANRTTSVADAAGYVLANITTNTLNVQWTSTGTTDEVLRVVGMYQIL